MSAKFLPHAWTARACGAALGCALIPVAVAAEDNGACPELAVDAELALVSKTGVETGRVRITGVVRHRRGPAWKSSNLSHYLQMALMEIDSDNPEHGHPVQPLVPIRQMGVSQQYRVDHQINWIAGRGLSYPRYVVRFDEIGATGASGCRWALSSREITPADIDRLFSVPAHDPPLSVKNYRLLGGVGVNTLEVQLAYRRKSSLGGRITASVAAPYSGDAAPVPVSGSHGVATIRVHVPCDAPPSRPIPISVTYRLWGSLQLPGGGGWVPSFSLEHSVPYREICNNSTGAVDRLR